MHSFDSSKYYPTTRKKQTHYIVLTKI